MGAWAGRFRLGALAAAIAMIGAGATVATTAVVLTAAPAAATQVNASNDSEFRAAWGDTTTPVTQIDLTADIAMSCGSGVWQRNAGVVSEDDVVVDGHGFTLDATGCNAQAMLNSGANLVTLQNVTLKGGNFDCACTHLGGGIKTSGDLTLIDAAVIDNELTNTTGSASAFPIGGGIRSTGTVRLTNSTVSGNVAHCEATCATASSGGISADSIIATNSTISDNTADEGGFGTDPDEAGGLQASSLTLTYSTVADNAATDGANIRYTGVSPMVSFASVIANPLFGGANCNVASGGSTSNGYNYESGTDTCGFGAGTGDVVSGANPSLGALATNGGVAQTRMPTDTSPLVEKIPPSACDDSAASTIVPLVDERGSPRPRGSGCDIGAVERPAGSFSSVTPTRILDTRNGTGLTGAFTAQQTRSLQVAGVGLVPSSASAVLLNVTATGGSKSGWLTLFPSDASLPTASNLNFKAGQTVANLVVVKVGFGGADEDMIKINNTGGNAAAGTVHVVADVMGYYRDATTGLQDGFTGLTPTRILDTRSNLGLTGVFTAQQTRSLLVGGVGGVPASADAVVMNVTATAPSKNGWLTVFPADASLPTASNLNFVAGQTVPNLVTVKLGVTGPDTGRVKINNTGGSANAGTVHVIADVVGYYKLSVGGSMTPMTPTRILDTRNGTGGVFGPVAGQATITVNPQTAAGMAAVGSYTAVVVNVTATAPTKNGWLTVFPSNASLPTASNLNFVAGQTVPNLVKINIGVDGKIKINNTGGGANAGTVQIVVDIVGYYTASIAT